MYFSLTQQYTLHDEACIRYKALLYLKGVDPDSREIGIARDEVSESILARTLLAERRPDGRVHLDPYDKWRGAHWVLSQLADLGHAGSDDLLSLRQQVYDWLFGDKHQKDIAKRWQDGRCCWHASMEGNALYYLLQLDLNDERTELLVERLLAWRWPDGGWNCDLKAKGTTSSFTETLWPLRGLALYARRTGDDRVAEAVVQAAEVFLERRLYRRRRDAQPIKAEFTALHYPCYWHYDILFALKVMHEAGLLGDPRCVEALDLLKSKQLADGGYPAQRKYYRVGRQGQGNDSLIDWGGTNKKKSNPFVSVEALGLLKLAGYPLE
jgi:hypothetical protein